MSLADRLTAALDAELAAAIDLRHRLHAEPDPSGQEGPTRDLVLAALPAGDTALVAETGAIRRIGPAGPAVGIRAELDALTVDERSDVPWRSRRSGVMHACGHDVHLAAVVAVARARQAVGDGPPMCVVLQPREETYPSGALEIVSAGALAEHGITAMVGAHLQPTLPDGQVACTPGVVNAAADEFTIHVTGRGGHAAYPHLGSDPVLAMASIIVALQQVVSRDVDPTRSVVVGVSQVQAGEAPNAMPGEAVARGTLRTMSEAARAFVHARVAEVAESVALAHRCQATVSIEIGEPVLANDPGLAVAVGDRLSGLGLTLAPPLVSFGADDFSYYCANVPSLMMFVGVDGAGAGLHHPQFVPNDAAVGRVARAMLAGYLGALSLAGR